MRWRAPILKWCWHLGQTFRLASRSAFQKVCRQPRHLVHRPSVRTCLLLASEPPLPPGPYSPSPRLNQDIETLSPENSLQLELLLVFYAALGRDALLVGVFYLAQLDHGVGQLDQQGMGGAAAENEVNHLPTGTRGFGNLCWLEHAVAALPTTRSAVPRAAVVLPLPGPVLLSRSPRRDLVMTGSMSGKAETWGTGGAKIPAFMPRRALAPGPKPASDG